QELTGLLLRIEQHYGLPQDIEWCHDGRQFWIVQSRPVTTVSTMSTRHPDPEWTRANLAEVLPEQTSPQALASYERLLNEGERAFLGRMLAPDAQLGPMFKVFRGRMYMNLSQARRLASLIGASAADMLRSVGHPEAIMPEDEISHRAPLGEILRAL